MSEFKLKISPRMLELLSKDLYTNVYFVLAELIANAYDADAENVYVFIDDDEIRIEDDGKGMTASDLESNYLFVGGESRTGEENSRTLIKKRLKMGRKGVGKLSALSISDGFKLVTVNKGREIGLFIPNRVNSDDETLRLLGKNEYTLKKIKDKGTAIIMERPKTSIPKLQETVLKNLGKIFPITVQDFKIHVIFKGSHKVLIPDEKDVIGKLGTLTIIGDEKRYLLKSLSKEEKNLQVQELDAFLETIEMLNNRRQMQNIDLRIYGWIGTYKTTKGMKKELQEFSDNYLAIFAHNKMGLRNVLSFVSKNRVYESYIVGNLYIDAFEASDFPDMAGTSRQGYNESDPRWVAASNYIREITDKAIRLHEKFAALEREEKELLKMRQKEEEEKRLKAKLEDVSKSMVLNISQKLKSQGDTRAVNKAVTEEIEVMKPLLGFKSTIDANKKKIMISQTLQDKPVADVVYNMLLHNGVPKEDIIYSNGSDPETNLPENDIYGYLRKFFIESVSTQKIYVLFITSKNVLNIEPDNPCASWGELMEIGAAWVTKQDHWIFNIDNFKPERPLNIEDKWVSIYTSPGEGNVKILSLTDAMVNSFCNKIIHTCAICGYSAKTFESNRNQLLKEYVTVYNP